MRVRHYSGTPIFIDNIPDTLSHAIYEYAVVRLATS